MTTKFENIINAEKERTQQLEVMAQRLSNEIRAAQDKLQQMILEYERAQARVAALEALTPDVFDEVKPEVQVNLEHVRKAST